MWISGYARLGCRGQGSPGFVPVTKLLSSEFSSNATLMPLESRGSLDRAVAPNIRRLIALLGVDNLKLGQYKFEC